MLPTGGTLNFPIVAPAQTNGMTPVTTTFTNIGTQV